MDDYSVTTLHESKNEWASRLVNILAPHIIEGFRSIFEEAYKLCKTNKEIDKYLMTFQNFLSRVPKWNTTIIDNETTRIKERSQCGYLEELITCVHIIQLKSMTSMRVGNKQKKVNIKIPNLSEFIHRVYINTARKLYSNVYIFERGIPALSVQRNNREFEVIVKECIFNTVRESIPVEDILKLYMDESVEDVIEVNEKEEVIQEDPILSDAAVEETTRRKRNNGIGAGKRGVETGINSHAPAIITPDFSDDLSGKTMKPGIKFGSDEVKSFEPVFEEQRIMFGDKGEDNDDDDDYDEDDRLNIGGAVDLDITDVHSLNTSQSLNAPPLLGDIEVLH
jgi:Family of unknown function (DUF5764)